MDQWLPTDQLYYRLPTDPAHVWRSAGTLADLECEHRLNQRRINLAQLADLLLPNSQHDFWNGLRRKECNR